MLVIIEEVAPVVLRFVNLHREFSTCPNVSNSHLVHGESTGLVRANVVGTAHDLAR